MDPCGGKNFPDLGKREVLAVLTRLPVAARKEGRRFRFTRRTLPRGPCSMEQQREKRKERRNINAKAKRWVGLFKSSRAGRNLVVQGMYYGSFRYWLYSTFINKRAINKIASNAARLLWSREPDLTKDTRYRRWIRATTAIGPKSKGGVSEMDWACHVDGFMAEWVLKYIQPGYASWKHVLDAMILQDRKRHEKFIEERSILFCELARRDKMRILKGIPRKAIYIKRCIYAFWELKLELDESRFDSLSGESPWRSPRVQVQLPKPTQKYMSTTLEVTQFSDLVKKETGKLLKRS